MALARTWANTGGGGREEEGVIYGFNQAFHATPNTRPRNKRSTGGERLRNNNNNNNKAAGFVVEETKTYTEASQTRLKAERPQNQQEVDVSAVQAEPLLACGFLRVINC
ncbi:hypothetical protein EYF80_032964 [Liparis tanakae]|uniref:Uncharacterized protein n=1 Tax=Liparis tanakae TaxID=230148 RepID=A0A4Z2GTE8_9TELE|nr:hypothetical protein EYF80_032964 [Liparis tanakae]